MLTVAWILSFCFSLPQSFLFRLFELADFENFKQCVPIWTIILNELKEIEFQLRSRPTTTEFEISQLIEQETRVHMYEKIYNVVHLLFVFWIPALIIVASYITVLCLLNSFTPSKRGNLKKYQSILKFNI